MDYALTGIIVYYTCRAVTWLLWHYARRSQL